MFIYNILQKSIKNFKEACSYFVTMNQYIDRYKSKTLVEETVLKDIRSYQKNDTKELFRYLKRKSQFVNKFNKKIRRTKTKSNIDKRLVKFTRKSFNKEIRYIKEIVESKNINIKLN